MKNFNSGFEKNPYKIYQFYSQPHIKRNNEPQPTIGEQDLKLISNYGNH